MTHERSVVQENIRYTLHNDRLNQRDFCKKQIRRSYSLKSITKENRYQFVFYINFDANGFYLKLGIGNRKHSYYHWLISLSQQQKTKTELMRNRNF